MFGYINTNQETLSEEEKATYKAYYCGLCQGLKENCGARGQVMLAYDMTFLIVLLTGLYELPDREVSFTCALHPAKKQKAFLNDATAYAADMNLILGYFHLLDDWKDEGLSMKKRLADRLESDYEKAAKRYPRQISATRQYLRDLEELEKEKSPNLEAAAGISGEILGEILAWREDEWAEELRCMGFYLGRFIYIMDAYEDLEKDRKHKTYNPLLPLFREKSSEEFESLCKCLLTSQIRECALAFERLPVLLHAGILRNILYSGIWSKYEIIQKKAARGKKHGIL